MTGGRQPYRKGAAFENETARYLRSLGALVVRNTGSKGDPLAAAFDLVSILPGAQVSLVECKLSGRLDPAPRKALIETATKYGVQAVLAKRGKSKGEIAFVTLWPT